MIGSRKLTVFLGLLFLLTLANSIQTLTKSATQSTKKSQDQTYPEYRNQFPVADYEAPEPSSVEERAVRRAKGARHDGRKFVSKDPTTRVSESAALYEGGEKNPLPVDQSTMVIIGKVVDARAFLSNDKENVYSEFNVSVEDVLKKDISVSIVPGKTLLCDREGGIVRYSNGHERLYRVIEQGMPVAGRQYLLFLRADSTNDYEILTGYELRSSDVLPIDYSNQFQQYKGIDKTIFVQRLRDALSKGVLLLG